MKKKEQVGEESEKLVCDSRSLGKKQTFGRCKYLLQFNRGAQRKKHMLKVRPGPKSREGEWKKFVQVKDD